MPSIRRKRATWLSSVSPQHVFYDVQEDEFQHDVDLDGDQLGRYQETLDRERQVEQEEVERRMAMWHDGRQDLLIDEFEGDDGDYFEYEYFADGVDDDAFFFDACDEEQPPHQLPGSIREVTSDVSTDDFQSCRGSLTESSHPGYTSREGSVVVGDDEEAMNGPATLSPISNSTPASAAASVASSAPSEYSEESEPTVGTTELEKAHISDEDRKMLSLGAHIKDTNVFALERLSDHVANGIVASYYAVFCLLVVYGVVFAFRDAEKEEQVAIIPEDATYTCFPQQSSNTSSLGQVPCTPNDAVTVNQANLLANTVVVADGINVTNWRGNGALPGTPPFLAHNITPISSFIIDKKSLNYDANPELHENWDDISAAVWIGVSGQNDPSAGVVSAKLMLHFTRTEGLSWDNAVQDDISLSAHLYACTRGANCSSVGSYREQLLQPAMGPSYVIFPKQSLDANNTIYELSLDLPNSLVGSDIIQAIGWRFVLYGGSETVFSACLTGDKCITSIKTRHEWKDSRVITIIDLALLIAYFFFFMYWIITLLVCSGWPWKWAVEQQWLLILGVALSVFNNPYNVSLGIMAHYRENYTFSQPHWYASLVASQFGLVMQLFCLALFADGPRRFVTTFQSFYWSKICFCYVYFIASAVALLWHFPEVNAREEPGNDRTIGGLGFLTIPITWPVYDKRVLVISTLVLLTQVVIAFIYYIVRCAITRNVLKSLPYNMTRPVQVSFRFYAVATIVWVLAELLFFVLNSLSGVLEGSQYKALIPDADFYDKIIGGLDQSQMLTKHRSLATVLFSTLFTAIFQFLFSPPSALGPVKTPRTHYVTEEEAAAEAKRERIKKSIRFRFRPKNILILQRARLLVICSREVYLPFEEEWSVIVADVEAKAEKIRDKGKGKRDVNALADSFLPWEISPSLEDQIRMAGSRACIGGKLAPKGSSYGAGCRVVAYVSEPRGLCVHDTRAMIFRHEPTGALILAFQGTQTVKQVKTDLMQRTIRVSLDTYLAVLSKRETERRAKKCIAPDQEERALLSGAQKRVIMIDLLHCDGEALPDYLQSSTKSRSHLISSVGRIHFGFWSSYNRIRRDIHTHLRRELVARPGPLYLCGHSLGGSLATVCAYDVIRWILPTVKKDLNLQGRTAEAEKPSLSVYTYGSPRCGDSVFAAAYDKVCKDSHRIVCDGDIITSGPPVWMGYRHVHKEVVFDYSGSIRVQPSVVERSTLRSKTAASSHRLGNYARVIKLSRQPQMSVVDLLNLLRDAYGIDRIIEKKPDAKDKTVDKGDAKMGTPQNFAAAEQTLPTAPSPPPPQPQSPPPPPPPPQLSPPSNAFDIIFG